MRHVRVMRGVVALVVRVRLADLQRKGRLNEPRDPFAGARHGRHDRHAEALLQRADIYLDPEVPRLIAHVERDGHRLPLRDQLEGEGEVPLEVRGIDHVDNALRAVDEIDRHARRLVERLERVGARRVNDAVDPAAEAHAAGRVAHGRARIVRGDRADAGEPREENALPDVGLPDEENVRAGVRFPVRRDRAVRAILSHCLPRACLS